MPLELIKERVALARAWFSAEPITEGLHIVSREDLEGMPALDTPEGMRWILDFFGKFGHLDHVTFDNIASLTTGSLKEEDGARALQALQYELTKGRTGQLWLHHTGLDATRGYGPKMREWHLDTVMVGEKRPQSDVDIAFTLKFSKARRRKPDNRSQFENIDIELRYGAWIRAAATSTQKSGGMPDSAKLCLAALRKALDELGKFPPTSSNTIGVRSAVTLEQWRDMFKRMSPYDDDDARRQAWKRGTERLLADRLVTKWGDWVWLP
jgi:hypothetical protein